MEDSTEPGARRISDAAAQQDAKEQSDFPGWFLDMIEPGEDDVAAVLDRRHAEEIDRAFDRTRD